MPPTVDEIEAHGGRVGDWSKVGPHYDALRLSMAAKLEREWPGRRGAFTSVDGGRGLVLGIYKAAENALGAARLLMADKPAYPARKPEYALAATPLSRQILEALCTIVFLFKDFPGNVDLHYKSGWRDIVENTKRMKAAYATDPEWQDYIAGHEAMIQHGITTFGITPEEQANPRKIKEFPSIGGMKRALREGSDRHKYISYLDDFFYRSFSQDSHHHFTGVAKAVSFLVPGQRPEDERLRGLEILRTRQVDASVTMMLALITELELELKFGLADQAKVLWSMFADFSADAEEIYDKFYARMLGARSPLIG